MIPFFLPLSLALLFSLVECGSGPHYANTTLVPTAATKVRTSFSSIDDGFYPYASYSWDTIQGLKPVTAGTVLVTVDLARNRTHSTTQYHTDYRANGSRTLYSRTDLNAAGTVTATMIVGPNSTLTMTYPNIYSDFFESISFIAILPKTDDYGTCCGMVLASSPAPKTHAPITTPPVTADKHDRRGWLYTLASGVSAYDGRQVSSMFPGQSLQAWYTGCFRRTCIDDGYTTTTEAGVEAVSAQALLLATSTTTISSVGDESKTKVMADPLSQAGLESSSPIPTAPASTSARVSGSGSSSTPQDKPATAQKPSQDSAAPTQTTSGSSPAASLQPGNTNIPAGSSEHSSSRPATTSAAAVLGGLIPSLIAQISSASASAGVSGAALSPSAVGNGPSPDASPANVQTTQAGPQNAQQTTQPGKTTTISQQAPPAPVVFEGVTVSQNSDSAFIVAGQTLAPGSAVTVGSGDATTVVVLQTQGSLSVLKVGGQFSTLPPAPSNDEPAPASPVVAAGVTISQDARSAFVADGQTLVPGSTIIVGFGSATTAIALQTSGPNTSVQVGDLSVPLPPAATTQQSGQIPDVVAAGVIISQDTNSAFVFGGQTLALGSTIVLGSGTETTAIALQTSGSSTFVQIGSSTIPIPTGSGNAESRELLTVVGAGVTLSQDSNSRLVIGGQTLTPGSAIIVGSGTETTAIVLQTSGTETFLRVGTSEIPLPAALPTYTFGTAIVTANSASQYILQGHTLTPGSATVIEGTTYSIPGGPNIGGYILSAIGQKDTSSTSTGSAGSTAVSTKPAVISSVSATASSSSVQSSAHRILPGWLLVMTLGGLLVWLM